MPTSPARDGAGRPLLLTASGGLLDDLLRVAAAAGVEPVVATDVGAARAAWLTAPVAVVGADTVLDVARLALGRRSGVVLVTQTPPLPETWEQAVAIGAEQVLVLPDADGWLAALLAESVEGHGRAGCVVCVVGGRGGAGATTLATALAVTASRSGAATALLDADPLGGGIDLVFGAEDAPGVRWPQLATTRGRVRGETLRDALPQVDGLAVVSWDRGDHFALPAAAMDAVLGAATRGFDVVVVDLPRRLDEAAELALTRSSTTLLVVPAEVRATAAAGRVAACVGLMARDLRVVVRGPAPAGLPAATVADSLGLPLAGTLRPEPRVAVALDRGEPPARRGRGPLADFCRQFLSTVVTDGRLVA